jgi:hypothetical protein
MVDDLHFVPEAIQRRSSDDFEFEDRHKPLRLFDESTVESPTRLRLSSFDDYDQQQGRHIPRQTQQTAPEQPAESCCGGNKEDENYSQSTDHPSRRDDEEMSAADRSSCYNDDDWDTELGFGAVEVRRGGSDQF